MNTKREGDASIEPLLRRALGSSSDRSLTGECLDAETLAAWTEGTLSKRDRAAAEAHASTCLRCQAVLAAVVRTAPPNVEERSWGSRGLLRFWKKASRPHSSRRWYAGWLVPLTAAAAAVAVWFALPGQQQPTLTDFQMARGRLEERAAPQTSSASPADAPKAAATAEPPPPEQARSTQAPLRQEAQPDREAPSAAARAAAPSGRNEGQEKREQRQLARQDKSDEAAAAAAAPLEQQAADSLAKAAPAPPPAAEKAAEPSSGLRDRRAAFALPATPARDIQSPDPAIRWRIGARGSVQYSRNQGATWEALPVTVTADLVAGSAPSPSICWVVGRAGTVLLSTDGRRFVPVPFPEMTDLSAVRATDARTATVTTVDGRTLSTVDGGSSWTTVPR